MVQRKFNPIPRHDFAEAVVRVNRIARELEHVTANTNCDTELVAVKASELREAAGVIRTWAAYEGVRT